MQHIPQCILLTGTRGVGKTTIGRIFAKCLNCLNSEQPSTEPCLECEHCLELESARFPDFYEIDAASHTKVEQIRELQEGIPYAPSKGRYKVYLIDEVHMLSKSSFNALLKTLEEPPAHVVFILATTDPQKLPQTILSRCLQFHLQCMPKEKISDHLSTVLADEGTAYDEKGLQLIAEAAKGSMRDAFSLLDQCLALGKGRIDTALVQSMLGTFDTDILYQIIHALADNDINTLMQAHQSLCEQGCDFADVLTKLCEFLQIIARVQLGGNISGIITDETCKQLADKLSPEHVQLLYQICLHGQRDLPLAGNSSSGFEMTLLRLLAFSPRDTANTPEQTQHKPMAAKAAQTRPQSQPTAQTPKNTSWERIRETLELTGLSASLAKACQLIKQDGQQWHFGIARKHKPMHQPHTQQAIEKALSEYLGQPCKISITEQADTSSKTPDPNPAAKQPQTPTTTAATQRTKSAPPPPPQKTKPTLNDNPNVNRIIAEFDAQILE